MITPMGDTERVRALVVDDVDVIGKLIALQLRDHGHECVSLSEHADILLDPDHDLWNVDVLVTDLRMPSVSGIQLLKIARQYHPQVYRIALTAWDVHSESLVMVWELAHRVLQKPQDSAEVVRIVDALAS